MSFLGRHGQGRRTPPSRPIGAVASEGGNTDRNVGGRQAGTTGPPPELPLDDDGNDARNIGG